ncbi:MAG: MCP four helix bundle domain-containing protein, partial [Telluria sp.]
MPTPTAIPMRFSRLRTATKIIGAFAVVGAAIAIVCAVALWRMQAADALTRDLVDNRLASQQLTAELLGVARLNGVRAGAIARSDSLEAGDYFQAQLSEGDKLEAALDARLHAMPADRDQRRLAAQAGQRKAAYLSVRKQVFQAKELGKTQEVEQLASTALATTFDAYVQALDTLLA